MTLVQLWNGLLSGMVGRFGAHLTGCLLVLLAVPTSAWAQSGQCGFIKDPNLQAQCRASTGGGSGPCGFIQDSDLQAFCRATNGGGSGQCGFIRDHDQQALCRAMTGGGWGQ
jgi:hypothetical protein